MRCIFCKCVSDNSKSVEHIIPESLGSIHVLPRGAVCDKCNNYFAIKIEQPLLSTVHFRNLRSRMRIPNKKGFVPWERAMLPGAGMEVAVKRESAELIDVAPINEKDKSKFDEFFLKRNAGQIFIPLEGSLDPRLLSRFIAKVGLEIFAFKTQSYAGWNKEIVEKAELDKIREYARRNSGPLWPISRRSIYGEERVFEDGEDSFHVLSEFDVLMTEASEFYSVLCIFGEEYAINMGGRSIGGYERWLSKNLNSSPLYLDRNSPAASVRTPS